jgi:hypothetical protein
MGAWKYQIYFECWTWYLTSEPMYYSLYNSIHAYDLVDTSRKLCVFVHSRALCEQVGE